MSAPSVAGVAAVNATIVSRGVQFVGRSSFESHSKTTHVVLSRHPSRSRARGPHVKMPFTPPGTSTFLISTTPAPSVPPNIRASAFLFSRPSTAYPAPA